MPQNVRQQEQPPDELIGEGMTLLQDYNCKEANNNERENEIHEIGEVEGEEERILQLQTFTLPSDNCDGTFADTANGRERMAAFGRQLISAWQKDGIFQLQMDNRQLEITARAMQANRHFVQLPLAQKQQFVSPLSYAGYICSGEERTAGRPDASEIFTLTKDVPMEDGRVRAGWPCHGPVCWPSDEYREAMSAFMDMLGNLGEKLLKLIALGLDLPVDTFCDITRDGWHHMRVLHFPERTQSGTKRGIGAHTDYGMLVLAHQDDIGGLYIRPPIAGEWRARNWLASESAAGLYEHDAQWYLVPPCAGTLTCFPGDMLQYLTHGLLLSTPHKVRLNIRERFSLAYFHEPNFNAVVRPLCALKCREGADGREAAPECIHYGTHFTSMFMRCYPERITTQRIRQGGGLEMLEKMRLEAMRNGNGGEMGDNSSGMDGQFEEE